NVTGVQTCALPISQLNRDFMRDCVTKIGGRTSHSAIMARSLEIPAIVGTHNITSLVENDDMVIVDGLEGTVIVNPSEEELAEYKDKQAEFAKQKEMCAKLKDEPTFSEDGEQVELGGNIGTPEDVAGVLDNGGEVVGLYRTEFLYMGQSELPSEETQYK